jgi:predicted O-methyltransferase YrrM
MKTEHFYHKLPNWFDFQEIYLHEIKRAPQTGATFVELGTWCGSSAAFMAVEIKNSGKVIDFATADLWKNAPMKLDEVEGIFAKHGVLAYCDFVVCDSAVMAQRFDSVDFAFIDASHAYEAVARDIQAWWPKIKSGGTLAGHDYYPQNPKNWPGVAKAVHDFVKRENLKLQHVKNSWKVKKP